MGYCVPVHINSRLIVAARLFESAGIRFNLIIFGLSIILTFLGLAIIRVGLVGRYLDRLWLVSHVKKREGEPLWYHRCITTGVGILALVIGTSLFILVILARSRAK